MEGMDINSRMRAVLVDWLVQVHLRFHLLQETLYLTVALLDRFLQVFKAVVWCDLGLLLMSPLLAEAKRFAQQAATGGSDGDVVGLQVRGDVRTRSEGLRLHHRSRVHRTWNSRYGTIDAQNVGFQLGEAPSTALFAQK